MLWLFVFGLFAAVSAEEYKAIVLLQGKSGTRPVRGNATFTQVDGGTVTISGIIEGLEPGDHGFHVHEKGDISSCSKAGGHFNPESMHHGGPSDTVRHVGDLGNVKAEANGVAYINIEDNMISLIGNHSIIGRAVVVHEGRDDFGKGGFEDSTTTGHAGGRLACGVIGILSPVSPWNAAPSLASMSLISLSGFLLITHFV